MHFDTGAAPAAEAGFHRRREPFSAGRVVRKDLPRKRNPTGKGPAMTEDATQPRTPRHEVGRRGDFVISTDAALLDVPLIHDYLSNQSYWAAGRPLDVVRRSMENSLCFGLYEQRRQAGLARVVTDRATFAWVCDVFVLP